MEKNLNAKIAFSFLSIYEKNVTCKRDPEARDRDETETLEKYVSRPSRDRDVETETKFLVQGRPRSINLVPIESAGSTSY